MAKRSPTANHTEQPVIWTKPRIFFSPVVVIPDHLDTIVIALGVHQRSILDFNEDWH